jgi:microcystin-dependent protein
MKKRLPTPDAPIGDVVYKEMRLVVPANVDLERHILGALAGISFWTSWDEVGTLSIDDTVQIMKQVMRSLKPMPLVGTIHAVYVETLQPSMLLCDGSVYNRSEYPQLWAELPSASKDATTFTVPDLREKFLFGASMDYPVGQEGGVAEVTLTVDEIPSHTHSYQTPTFNVDIESVGVPDPTGVGQPQLPATTGSTGGNQPHENMPPYFSIRYAIYAGFVP